MAPNLRIGADFGCHSARAPGRVDSGREAGTDSGLRDDTLGGSDPSPGASWKGCSPRTRAPG